MAQSSTHSSSSALVVLGIIPTSCCFAHGSLYFSFPFYLSCAVGSSRFRLNGAEPAHSFTLPALITLLIASWSSSAHCSSLISLKTYLHGPGTSPGEHQQKLWGWNFSSWGWEYLDQFSRVFSRTVLDIWGFSLGHLSYY